MDNHHTETVLRPRAESHRTALACPQRWARTSTARHPGRPLYAAHNATPPLLPCRRPLLDRLLLSPRGCTGSERPVIMKKTYKEPIGRQGWKRSWATACRKAGLENFRFHDLRHIFVTRKVRQGWDDKRIMAITGHKTFAVFQRYNNPSEDDIKAVVLADPPRKVIG